MAVRRVREIEPSDSQSSKQKSPIPELVKPGSHEQNTQSNYQAVYVISVAAELVNVHPQTLRIYERKGLLDPQRTKGGGRRYSEYDIECLRRIKELTSQGLNLEGIKKVIELEKEVAYLKEELVQTVRQSKEDVERTHKQYRRDLVLLRQMPVVYKKR